MPRMALSLASLPLPDGFEPRGALAVEQDEESGKVYEMWMLDTALPFDAAVAALSAFAQQHFGGQKREAATDLPGVRSWAANWTQDGQEVSAQLTCADADSAGYLRNVYPYTS